MSLFLKPHLVELSLLWSPKCFKWYRHISEKVSSVFPILCDALDKDLSGIRRLRRGKVATAEQSNWVFTVDVSLDSQTFFEDEVNEWLSWRIYLPLGKWSRLWLWHRVVSRWRDNRMVLKSQNCFRLSLLYHRRSSNENLVREKALALNHRP